MGVSGCGKTTVGRVLAQRLGIDFQDADDYHSFSNKEKMRRGEALTDTDRKEWLEALHEVLISRSRENVSTVLACSALKEVYRDSLMSNVASAHIVYLKAEKHAIEVRLSMRVHEYMNPSLLDSQFEVLEEPKNAIEVDASADSVDTIVERIIDSMEQKQLK